MSTELRHKVALSFLHGIGPRKALKMVSKAGSVDAIFHEKIHSLHQLTGIGKSVLADLRREEALRNADQQLELSEKNGWNIHFFLDTNYPRRLKHAEDAPIILYSSGKINVNPRRTIAVVGTRAASAYGKILCEELIESVQHADVQVISGMAYGIDICAHRACIQRGISTIGVLGHGLDILYPQVHRKTAQLMLENGGLLTEFIPGTNPDRENFPMRNRIVAGMADATIVIESQRKGGSLITAELANDYNRDVFAYPGNVGVKNSEGCNYLIAHDKAHLITSGKDLLLKMGWEPVSERQTQLRIELSPPEKTIYAYLEGKGTLHVDEIAIHTNTPISLLHATLLQLELKGLLRSTSGNRYQLVP
jgi:DNA processing protein